MCNNFFDSTCFDLFSIIISIILPFLLYTIKPRLKIQSIEEVYTDSLTIKVKNIGCCKAYNLKVEAAIVDPCNNSKKYTYHLNLDRFDFLILYRNEDRNFITEEITKTTLIAINRNNKNDSDKDEKEMFKDLLSEIKSNSCWYLRVRVHSNHGISGFGKAVEQKFNYCKNTKKFIKVK